MTQAQAYEVYVNNQRSRAIIHDATCRQLRKRGGVSRTTPPTGHYSGRYDRFDDACAYARRQNKQETRTGGCCLGTVPLPSPA